MKYILLITLLLASCYSAVEDADRCISMWDMSQDKSTRIPYKFADKCCASYRCEAIMYKASDGREDD